MNDLTQRNKEAFAQSRFFVSVPQKINLPVLEKENAETSFHKASFVQEENIPENKKEPVLQRKPEENMERQSLTFSEENLEPMPEPTDAEAKVQEVSDEIERLSQRYGQDMEGWMYDES